MLDERLNCNLGLARCFSDFQLFSSCPTVACKSSCMIAYSGTFGIRKARVSKCNFDKLSQLGVAPLQGQQAKLNESSRLFARCVDYIMVKRSSYRRALLEHVS